MRARMADTPLDNILIALSDPTRRTILRRLAHAEARVTDLAKPFRISLNSVSKHIRILERARLVKRRRAGREHILHYCPEPLNRVQDWISQQQQFWQSSLAAIDELLSQTPENKESR